MRAAASRSKPANRPAVIVIPDRDVPGLRASAWAAPMTTASRACMPSIFADARHAVGEAEEQPAEDQRDGDDRRRAEVLVDLSPRTPRRPPPPAPSTAAAARRCGRRGRRRPARRPQRTARNPARDVAGEVVAEVGDGGDQRADVEGDVERLLDAVVVEVVPAEQPGHEQQVAARRDRQELGQSLDEAEDDGVEDAARRRRLRQRSRSRRQAPLIVTSRITRLTPAAPIGSQSTSAPTSTTSRSIRCSVDPIVNSRTGAPSLPSWISRPDAPGREVAAHGLTPECSPYTMSTRTPSSMSATSAA